MNVFSKIKEFYQIIKERTVRGYKWIGADGLINLETSALLTIIFMIFFSKPMSVFLTFIIMLTKCIIDTKKGRLNEKHDLICASIGIIVGFIIGLV